MMSHNISRKWLTTLILITILVICVTYSNLFAVFPSDEPFPGNIPYQNWISSIIRSLRDADFLDQAQDIPSEPMLVHYFLLHKNLHPGPESFLSFMECMSVLSVMKNLSPDAIYLHTNRLDFWPFESCKTYINNWSHVKLVYSPRKRTIAGKRIHFIEHEVDIIKLEILQKYGGLVLDFDVFLINGDKLRRLMTTSPCVVCKEVTPRLNAGFVACKKSARYPRIVYKESYLADFRPKEWLYNSGDMTWKIHQQHNDTAYVVYGVCDSPIAKTWDNRKYLYDWTDKIALHSFFHDRTYTEKSLQMANSSFADLINWILTSLPLSINDNKQISIFGP